VKQLRGGKGKRSDGKIEKNKGISTGRAAIRLGIDPYIVYEHLLQPDFLVNVVLAPQLPPTARLRMR
jgi:hypothetical protein